MDDDAGWNSGSMGQRLSGFNPAVLIIEVQELLRRRGVPLDPTPGMLYTASIAAADLLRALGVKPESAPIG